MTGGDCWSYWLSYGDRGSHVVVEYLEFLRCALFVYRILASALLDVRTRIMYLSLR